MDTIVRWRAKAKVIPLEGKMMEALKNGPLSGIPKKSISYLNEAPISQVMTFSRQDLFDL